MTKDQVEVIIERLDRIELDISNMRVEMAETRGAYKLAKLIVGFLGLTGLSSLVAWLASQGGVPAK